jgi:hypothetical protein
MEFDIISLLLIAALSIAVILSGIESFKQNKELNLLTRKLTELEYKVETWKKAHSKCTDSCCVEKVLDDIIGDMD